MTARVTSTRLRSGRAAATVLGCCLGLPALAHAATFLVDDAADLADAVPGDGECRSASGTCALRAAIQEANALPGADAIELPDGVFLLSLVGADEDAAASGDLDVTDDLVITGSAAGPTIIDGGGLDRVLHLPWSTEAVELTLSALVIQGGNGIPSNPLLPVANGGGIAAEYRHVLHLVDVVVRDNVSVQGGGVSWANADGSAVGCRFERNRAHSRPGDGEDARGGALSLQGGRVTIEDSDFLDNRADLFGGVMNGRGAAVSFSGCSFERNLAGLRGGAIYCRLGGLDFAGCLFADNRAQSGGAVHASSMRTTFRDCAFLRNVATIGSGGAMNVGEEGVLTNVTLSGNRADQRGGAIYLDRDTTLVMAFTTIAENAARFGGGLSARDQSVRVVTRAGLLAGNTASESGPDCNTLLELTGPTFVTDPTGGCDSIGPPAFDRLGVDPLLLPLQSDRLQLPSHPLAPTSPALDVVGASDCLDPWDSVLLQDQRGVPRPLDGDGDGLALCDAGARESTHLEPDSDGDAVPDPDDCAAADPTAFAVPAEVILQVARRAPTDSIQLTWTDLAASSGLGTRYEVARDLLAALAPISGASAPCVATDLPSPDWSESRGGPSRYYLVRGVNACGPQPGEQWGVDAFLVPRPTCP